LILMDVQMPEMSGIEVTTEIRRQEKETGGHVPIIATTASALNEDRARCLAAGMDAYLSKPIEREIFYETIDQLTYRISRQSERAAARKGAALGDPIFDAAAVLDSLEGDSELLREVAGIFLTQAPVHMEKIRRAISELDPKLLERAAHALRGSAANLLAQRIVGAATKLEEIGNAGSVEGAEKIFLPLVEELGKLASALEDLEKEYAKA
jgi:CheY-like chemotaxis protein